MASPDHEALVAEILSHLSGKFWSPTTLDHIADTLRGAGYTIDEPDETAD